MYSYALHLLLLSCAAQWPALTVQALKIGVSKMDITTLAPNTTTATTTTTTTTTTSNTLMPETTTALLLDDFETITTTTAISTTSANTTPTTTVHNFTIPIFPPRKPSLRTTTQTIPATTAATSTTMPTLRDINDTLLENDTAITTTLLAATLQGNFYCYCDLLLHACDVNCCCDRDCSIEALVVFDCNVVPKHPELRNRLEDFQYQHGLPSCKINDGWLCVFRSNVKPPKAKPINLDLDTTRYYRWSSQVVIDEQTTHTKGELYKYGDPLKLLNLLTMETENFELPHAFRQPHCQIQEPIRYLKTYTETCLAYSAAELQLPLRKLLQAMRQTRLLLRPLKQPAEEEEHIEHVLDTIKISLCQADKCLDLELTNSTDTELVLEDFYANAVVVQIVHNYTQLLAARIELHTPSFDWMPESGELWQSYAVKFIYKNHTQSTKRTWFDAPERAVEATMTSGPLGYLQGEPLIVAQFVAYNQSEELSAQNQVLSYFQPNASKAQEKHTLQLFTKRQALCYKNAEKRNYINYGISTLKQCNVRLEDAHRWAVEPAKANFTALCVRLQRLAFAQLFGDDFADLQTLFVSQLGKPQNRSDKWTPLRVENVEQPPLLGQYHAPAQSFSCRNVLLSASYEFQVGRFLEMGIAHQALLKRARLVLGQRNDLEFALDETIEVPLTISVMFYDYAASDVVNGAAAPLQRRLSSMALAYAIFYALSIATNGN